MTDSIYPLVLYRDGDEFEWDGRGTDRTVVEDKDAHDAALTEGWAQAADYLASVPHEESLLDGSAKDIAAALPDLSLEELEKLKADEQAGKTRKGVLSLIDTAIDEKLKA
jgi:hypothetical protein